LLSKGLKYKIYKSAGIDQTLAELIRAGGNILCSEIHKLINSVWNKEELPQQWKKYIIVLIYKKGNKLTWSYTGISLAATYIQNLIQYPCLKVNSIVGKIIGDHQCGFQHNRSITYQIFCISQVLEKNGSIVEEYDSYSYISRRPVSQ
jgi:hypothetical protein